jgi:hypothetical protein
MLWVPTAYHLLETWQEIMSNIKHEDEVEISPNEHCRKWLFKTLSKLKKLSKDITRTLLQTRKDEWYNAKNHYIRIGKYGQIARMINPKDCSGPVASKKYPTRPGEEIRYALNDEEREEASILTHSSWMADPPGLKNCHFLDILSDDIGPCSVTVNRDKPFDIQAQWQYLDGLLEDKVDAHTAA